MAKKMNVASPGPFGGAPPKAPEDRFDETLLVKLRVQDMEQVRQEAAESGRSLSAVGREAVERWAKARVKKRGNSSV